MAAAGGEPDVEPGGVGRGAARGAQLRGRTGGPELNWLLVHLVAVAVLTGIGWVVQVVVYPAFALVGEAEWAAYHRRHGSAIAAVVLLPWLVQGVSTAALLVEGLVWTSTVLAVLAVATVVLTVAAAVPAHGHLTSSQDPGTLRRLLRANLLRTLCWTASTLLAAALTF